MATDRGKLVQQGLRSFQIRRLSPVMGPEKFDDEVHCTSEKKWPAYGTGRRGRLLVFNVSHNLNYSKLRPELRFTYQEVRFKSPPVILYTKSS